MDCKLCGTALNEGQNVCPLCGTVNGEANAPVEEAKDTETVTEDTAAPVDAVDGATVTEPESPFTSEAKPKKFNFDKKLLTKLAIPIAAVVLILAVVLIIASNSGKNPEPLCVYIKDGELCLVYNDKDYESEEITRDLFKVDEDETYLDAYDILNYSSLLYTSKTDRLFFPDKIDEDGYSLYYIDTTPKDIDDNDAEKIDSSVVQHSPVNDGKAVYYVTESSSGKQTLNYFDFKDSEEIDTADNIAFISNTDGSILMYVAEDEGENEDDKTAALYSMEKPGKFKKIIKDTYEMDLEYVSDDLSLMIFTENGNFYRLTDGKKYEKISGISYDEENEYINIPFVDSKGNIYYTKSELISINPAKYVNDYTGDAVEVSFSKLYKFDGKKSVELCDYYYTHCIDKENDVLVYGQYDVGSVEKVDMDDLYDSDDMEYSLKKLLCYDNENYNFYSTSTKGEKVISAERIYDVAVHDGYLYYLECEEDEDEDSGDLYKKKLSASSKAEKIGKDVYTFDITEKGKIISRRDRTEDYTFDLYVGEKKIDSDVVTYMWDEEENIYYLTDYDDDEGGTLRMYNGKKSEKIAKDVFDIRVAKPGYVYYLTDFDESDDTSKLMLYANGEEITIAKDVVNGLFRLLQDISVLGLGAYF